MDRNEERQMRREQVTDLLGMGCLDLPERIDLQAQLIQIEQEELADMRRELERDSLVWGRRRSGPA